MKPETEVKYKNKEFRIYKWDKPVRDFPIPKGFQLCSFNDFVELYDNDIIKLVFYDVYFTKSFSKKNMNYSLVRFILGRGSFLDVWNNDLAGSSGIGRVVISRRVKKSV